MKMKAIAKENNDTIISSFSFDSQGKGYKLNPWEVARELKTPSLSWVHLNGNSETAKKWLEEKVSYLDHLIIDALFADETRPRIMEFEKGMLIILRGVNLNHNSEIEDMVSVRLWIDEHRVVSVQKRNFTPIFDLMEHIEAGKKIRNSGEFLYNLVYEILSSSTPIISELNSKLDTIEERVCENRIDSKLREALTLIRKQSAVFKRYMLPQKDVFSHLKTNEYHWIDEWAIRHFQENYDQICHLIEELDEAKERSQIIHQETSNSITDRLNKSMFKVSLVASIFLPLGFIASLFGMNVGGLPLENNSSGFYIVIYFMTVFFGGLFLFMRNFNSKSQKL